MSEVTSLVLIGSSELNFIGKFVSNIWRLFLDNQLSIVLTKLETVHEKLILMNVVRPMKIKRKGFLILGIIVHLIGFNIHQISGIIHNIQNTNIEFLKNMVIIKNK